MRLDIYRRAERAGVFSYLAVPEGKRLPEEVTNTDWDTEEKGVDFNDDENELPHFSIENVVPQIKAKGYAITSIKKVL